MSKENNNYTISGAIILGSIIIASAVIFTNSKGAGGAIANNNANNENQEITIREVSSDDHIKGDPNAPITIVEYSDFECPFCQRVHPTIDQIVSDYPGDVNWVYRHYPLTNSHFNAQSSAIASECVAKLAGNEAFWQFADSLFNNQTTLGNELYKSLASDLDIDADDFNSCLSDKSIAEEVNKDRDEVIKAGGRGTPYSIIIDKDGNMTPLSGALPYESWQQIIEQMI